MGVSESVMGGRLSSRESSDAEVNRAVQPSLGGEFDIVIPAEFAPGNQVTFYPGDCMELLRSMPDECVQLVVTSPPYNIGKEYEDVLDIDVYKAQQRQVIRGCVRLLTSPGAASVGKLGTM